MASLKVQTRSYTHKNPSNSRGTISRTRVTNNGQKVNLRQLAARRTLKPRQNEGLYKNGNRVGDRRVYTQRTQSQNNAKEAYRRAMFRASGGGVRYVNSANQEDSL